MTISIFAAIGRHRELGKKGRPFWKAVNEMRYFNDVTVGKPLIMGRKTFESLPIKPPSRQTIVLSRNPEYGPHGALVAQSLDDALDRADVILARSGEGSIMVVGGAALCQEVLPFATRLYLTLLDAKDFEADSYFPPYEHEFSRTMLESPGEDGGVRYRFVILEREKASE